MFALWYNIIIYLLTVYSLYKTLILGIKNHIRVNWELIAYLKLWSCKSKMNLFSILMISLLSLTIIGFIFITASFIINNSHFLLSLLCLEGIILRLVIFVPHVISSINIASTPLALIILTFGACEARLGLRIIVKMSRHYGSDTLRNLSINKC